MVETIKIETDQWFAHQIYGGRVIAWTLPARLGQMLRRAESIYGARDVTYTILGVEFAENAPNIRYFRGWRQAIVQITPACATDTVAACYQMARECIHLLSPPDGRQFTVLEEGLATHFSHRYLREYLHAVVWVADELESYRNACILVEQLLAVDPGVMRSLRQRQISISHITVDDIQAACPQIPLDLATALTQPFAPKKPRLG